ncbi:MAG: bifunctional adenosylcobinamide kinase/adenosylcobinamide-phosphate guanylyltransferase [Paracoccaceae bacterium]
MTAHALVLGGARSGKSSLALRMAEAIGPRRRFVATAEAFDAEMADRIARHKRERGAGWETLEAPLDLTGAIGSDGAADVVLVDCLTLWLSNLMFAGRDPAEETAIVMAAVHASRAPVILVSNEVGLGLVPETPLGRAFRDAQGRLNQTVATHCRSVVFVAAGLQLSLKGPAPET